MPEVLQNVAPPHHHSQQTEASVSAPLEQDRHEGHTPEGCCDDSNHHHAESTIARPETTQPHEGHFPGDGCGKDHEHAYGDIDHGPKHNHPHTEAASKNSKDKPATHNYGGHEDHIPGSGCCEMSNEDAKKHIDHEGHAHSHHKHAHEQTTPSAVHVQQPRQGLQAKAAPPIHEVRTPYITQEEQSRNQVVKATERLEVHASAQHGELAARKPRRPVDKVIAASFPPDEITHNQLDEQPEVVPSQTERDLPIWQNASEQESSMPKPAAATVTSEIGNTAVLPSYHEAASAVQSIEPVATIISEATMANGQEVEEGHITATDLGSELLSEGLTNSEPDEAQIATISATGATVRSEPINTRPVEVYTIASSLETSGDKTSSTETVPQQAPKAPAQLAMLKTLLSELNGATNTPAVEILTQMPNEIVRAGYWLQPDQRRELLNSLAADSITGVVDMLEKVWEKAQAGLYQEDALGSLFVTASNDDEHTLSRLGKLVLQLLKGSLVLDSGSARPIKI